MRSILFLGLLIIGFVACNSGNNPDQEKNAEETHTHDANAHMNQKPFEELVASFDDPERDKWQRPHIVMAALKDLSNKTVVDIGAGSGYFTTRLMENAGKVIAVDIDQRFLDYIQSKADSMPDGLKSKLELRKAEEADPKLDSAEADLILIVDTWHHLPNRVEYARNLKRCLKPGGQLVVIDFKKGELPYGPPDEMKISEETVKTELLNAGFRTISSGKILEYQYFLTAYNE